MYRDELEALSARCAELEKDLADRERAIAEVERKRHDLEVAQARSHAEVRKAILADEAAARARISKWALGGVLATCASIGAITAFIVYRTSAGTGSPQSSCDPIEVGAMKGLPPADTPEGASRRAACQALAGHVADAQATIDALATANARAEAARYVFKVAHPAADAADTIAMGELMELTLTYDPTNAQALYHAAMGHAEAGEWARAAARLRQFIEIRSRERDDVADARAKLARLLEHQSAMP
jgi:hypothetical protein